MDAENGGTKKEESIWPRLVFMVLFAIAFLIAGSLLAAVVVIQFLFKVFTGKVLDQITTFGQYLATYFYEIIRFLTFRSDEMPWPIGSWPDGPPRPEPVKPNLGTGETESTPDQPAKPAKAKTAAAGKPRAERARAKKPKKGAGKTGK